MKTNEIKGLFYSLELVENPYSKADKKKFFELQHKIQIDICKQIVSNYSLILSNKPSFNDWIIRKGISFEAMEKQLNEAKAFLSQYS
jgi:hypothetical protein